MTSCSSLVLWEQCIQWPHVHLWCYGAFLLHVGVNQVDRLVICRFFMVLFCEFFSKVGGYGDVQWSMTWGWWYSWGFSPSQFLRHSIAGGCLWNVENCWVLHVSIKTKNIVWKVKWFDLVVQFKRLDVCNTSWYQEWSRFFGSLFSRTCQDSCL